MRACILIALTLLLAAVSLSCTEKNILNVKIVGAIAGRVYPAVAGAVVRVEETDGATTTDADGSFMLSGLEDGDYDVEILAEGYSRRLIHDVAVLRGQVTSVGNVALSTLPFPVFGIYPADNATGVRVDGYFYVLADERLNLSDLNANTASTPTIRGHWIEDSSYSYESIPLTLVYRFVIESLLTINTSYRLTVHADTRTAAGQPLGRDLSITFVTLPLTALFGISGDPSSAPMNDPRVFVQFNDTVHVDSLNRASRINPPIDARWKVESVYGNGITSTRFRLVVPFGTGLLPETEYWIIIEADVPLSSEETLAERAAFHFLTQGYRVTEFFPDGGSMHRSDSLLLRFNVPMDTASVDSAVMVAAIGESLVPLGFRWDEDLTSVRIGNVNGWQTGKLYEIRLRRSAKGLTGIPVSDEFVSYFSIR